GALADREALHILAEFGAWNPHHGRQEHQRASTAGEEPCGHAAASGGSERGPNSNRSWCFLSPHRSSTRQRQSRGGNRPQDGLPHLPVAPLRRRVPRGGRRLVRTTLPAAEARIPAKTGPIARLRPHPSGRRDMSYPGGTEILVEERGAQSSAKRAVKWRSTG